VAAAQPVGNLHITFVTSFDLEIPCDVTSRVNFERQIVEEAGMQTNIVIPGQPQLAFTRWCKTTGIRVLDLRIRYAAPVVQP
jgi:hypothetical protein